MIHRFSGKYRFLSNFFPSEILANEKSYATVEHLYQSMKSIDVQVRESIRLAGTPGKAKRLGQAVTLRSDWNEIKIPIMAAAIKKKFQIPELRQLLLETADEELVEGNNWGDQFWGICNGRGQNMLGKLLMAERTEIRLFHDM